MKKKLSELGYNYFTKTVTLGYTWVWIESDKTAEKYEYKRLHTDRHGNDYVWYNGTTYYL